MCRWWAHQLALEFSLEVLPLVAVCMSALEPCRLAALLALPPTTLSLLSLRPQKHVGLAQLQNVCNLGEPRKQ